MKKMLYAALAAVFAFGVVCTVPSPASAIGINFDGPAKQKKSSQSKKSTKSKSNKSNKSKK